MTILGPQDTTRPARLSRRRLLASSVPTMLIMSGCTGRTGRPVEPSGPLPADRLVFSVVAWPGFAAPIQYALASASLVVRGDGRVTWLDSQRTIGAVPPRYLTAQIDPMAVARFAAHAEATGLIAEGVEFGYPRVTDLGQTSVVLDGASGRASVAPYAFSEQFDRMLDRKERANRRRLRDLIADARGLTAEAEVTPYVPDRIVVHELRPTTSTAGTVAPWPGPDPATFLHPAPTRTRWATRCGELTGRLADTVYVAAQSNPNQRWLVDGRPVTLAINALPTDEDC